MPAGDSGLPAGVGAHGHGCKNCFTIGWIDLRPKRPWDRYDTTWFRFAPQFRFRAWLESVTAINCLINFAHIVSDQVSRSLDKLFGEKVELIAIFVDTISMHTVVT